LGAREFLIFKKVMGPLINQAPIPPPHLPQEWAWRHSAAAKSMGGPLL
jgi:hypothetical protein